MALRGAGRVPLVALHATTIRFADRAYMAIARAADSQGISVSQYVREAALIRALPAGRLRRAMRDDYLAWSYESTTATLTGNSTGILPNSSDRV